MNEEKLVAGLGSPETSTVLVVSPCRPVSSRASPRVNPILFPLGPELGVCDFFTRCALDCHPATTLPVLNSLSTIQAMRPCNHSDGGGQGDDLYADLRGGSLCCVRSLKSLLQLSPTSIPTPWSTGSLALNEPLLQRSAHVVPSVCPSPQSSLATGPRFVVPRRTHMTS